MGCQWVGRYWAGEVGKVKKDPPPGAAVPGGREHQAGKAEADDNAGSTEPSMVVGFRGSGCMGGPAREVAPYGLWGALALGGKLPGALKVAGKCLGAATCLCTRGAACGSSTAVCRVGWGRESFSCFSLACKNTRIVMHT